MNKLVNLFLVLLLISIYGETSAQFHKMFGANVGPTFVMPQSSELKVKSLVGIEGGLAAKIYFNYNLGAYFGVHGGLKRMATEVKGTLLDKYGQVSRQETFYQTFKMPFVLPEAYIILVPFTYPFYIGAGGFFDAIGGSYPLDKGYSDTEITFENVNLNMTLKDFKKDMKRANYGPSFYLGFMIGGIEFKANYRLGMVTYKGKDALGNKWSLKYNQFTIGLYHNFLVYGCSHRECHLH